jgi:hypothetical protein
MAQVLVVAVIGIGIFLVGFFQMKKSRAAASWPSAPGTIRKAELGRDQAVDHEATATLTLCIEYNFQASGHEHVGTRIRFDETLYHSTKEAQKALSQYPVGGPVTVYFDPNNPAECVLMKRNPSGTMFLVVGAIMVIVAIAGAFK